MIDIGSPLEALAVFGTLLTLVVGALFVISLTGWGWPTVGRIVIGILLAVVGVSLFRRRSRSS